MKKIVVILLIISAPILYFYSQGEPPVPSAQDTSIIDVSKDPIQTDYKTKESFKVKNDIGDFTITTVAEYKISAVVASKKGYSMGWQGEMAPVDLALIWGRLPDPENDKYITYSQSNRFYFYHFTEDSPFNYSYIGEHSSNHHIIPATENVYRAIRSIKKKDVIYMEGYLVNIKGGQPGREVWWNSSLTRRDSGNGACELFYVKKVRIGDNVYQ